MTQVTQVTQVTREWLEADGLGGFASGPVAGPRTRRYHALLLAAAGPRRFVLVNGCEAVVSTPAGTWTLTVQSFDGARAPSNHNPFFESYGNEPWPTWSFRLPDGTRLVHELFAVHGQASTALTWRLLPRGDQTPGDSQGSPPVVELRVRPFLSGRDYHALHHENPAFAFAPVTGAVAGAATGRDTPDTLIFRPYPDVPAVHVRANGTYTHQPLWYRAFFYEDEAARGLDATEDLAAPGVLTFALHEGAAELVFATESPRPFTELRRAESARRASFLSPLHRAADAFVVARPGGGRTIIAGYPWFTDWGRDTFIAVRGLCLATGALDDARAILLRWADVVSEGMLPNRFPDDDGAPEYNAVDAAFWFVVATYELLQLARSPVTSAQRARLLDAIERILVGHAAGTRFGIHAADDGLLAAGQPGVQLTWMDAKFGDWVVTPRIGKPVEIQALWLNALRIGDLLALPSAARWRALYAQGHATFLARFWDPSRSHLFDVVDDDHQPGRHDPTLRPNQIFAVGGLPFALLEGARARAVVDAVERELLTPLGLRSLGPREPGYHPRYEGDMRARDGAYHQGTVWPWLMGAFVEAWVRVRSSTVASAMAARNEAAQRFVAPLLAHLGQAGAGHVSEVADGEPPHLPGGCPFQAWSLGELLRILAHAQPLGRATLVTLENFSRAA